MTMTNQLKTIFDRLEQLPKDQQDDIVQMILDRLDDLEWDLMLASPKGQATLKKLAAEAEQEITQGQVEEMI
jgi:hypothetical protein